MRIVKIYRRCLWVTLVLAVAVLTYLTTDYIEKNLPEKIMMNPNKVASINLGIPVSLTDKDTAEETGISSNLKINSTSNGKYEFIYKLFGVIPVKEVDVTVTNRKLLTPVGIPVGLYLQTQGVMVIDEGEIIDEHGNTLTPARGKVISNDYIVYFNDTKVNSKSQLAFLTKQNGPQKVTLKLMREKRLVETEINPVKDEYGDYKLGIWVRDDAQGIGTLTYVDQEGNFGALGHGVSDIDTGKLLGSTNGKIYEANIWGIKKGEDGAPGGLCGTIDYDKKNIIGSIKKNTNSGLYGDITNINSIDKLDLSPIEVAYKQEIEKGAAWIQIMLDGELRKYQVEIQKINLGSNSKEKNFVIEVKDKELLNKTNGIVQGMSGSPIIQNGKLIGAVTHVFVDDCTKGYGIFVENMLEH